MTFHAARKNRFPFIAAPSGAGLGRDARSVIQRRHREERQGPFATHLLALSLSLKRLRLGHCDQWTSAERRRGHQALSGPWPVVQRSAMAATVSRPTVLMIESNAFIIADTRLKILRTRYRCISSRVAEALQRSR